MVDEVGATRITVAFTPVLQEYDCAPLPESVVEFPMQTETSAPALTTGSAFTKTVAVSILVQLFALVPITVYVDAEVGATTIDVDEAPVLHEYVCPPLPVSVAELPKHTETSAPALTTGREFTKTIAESVLVQPFEFVPMTV